MDIQKINHKSIEISIDEFLRTESLTFTLMLVEY